MSAGWTPLLDGALHDEALRVVCSVADELCEQASAEDGSLAGGHAGNALLLAYAADATDNDVYLHAAVAEIERALAWATHVRRGPSLYSGLAGVFWMIQHLERHHVDLQAPELYSVVDGRFLQLLQQDAWVGHYDLINGIVGVGVYCLERLPNDKARATLLRVLEVLERTAQRDASGARWLTEPRWIEARGKRQAPRGYHDLGVAHGIAGVVALLARLYASDVAAPRCLQLLREAMSWLFSQRMDGEVSELPDIVIPDVQPRPSRLAWCFGDLGIATAVLAAAHATGDTSWRRAAVELARSAARRSQPSSGVCDAGLCHGAAGVAHLFNRLFQATRIEELAQASRAWFDVTLQHRGAHAHVAEFAVWWPEQEKWIAKPGLLMGSVGIALALLSAARPTEPRWDRALLVDTPRLHGDGEPGEPDQGW